jgi:hypothetical protein
MEKQLWFLILAAATMAVSNILENKNASVTAGQAARSILSLIAVAISIRVCFTSGDMTITTVTAMFIATLILLIVVFRTFAIPMFLERTYWCLSLSFYISIIISSIHLWVCILIAESFALSPL